MKAAMKLAFWLIRISLAVAVLPGIFAAYNREPVMMDSVVYLFVVVVMGLFFWTARYE